MSSKYFDYLQLWRNMKPDVELKSMVTKQWQDVGLPHFYYVSLNCLQIGFQGTSPSTDFRSTGLLGSVCWSLASHLAERAESNDRLDQLLHLSSNTPARAQRLVEESVEGGAHWYPLAIVSIGAYPHLLLIQC